MRISSIASSHNTDACTTRNRSQRTISGCTLLQQTSHLATPAHEKRRPVCGSMMVHPLWEHHLCELMARAIGQRSLCCGHASMAFAVRRLTPKAQPGWIRVPQDASPVDVKLCQQHSNHIKMFFHTSRLTWRVASRWCPCHCGKEPSTHLESHTSLRYCFWNKLSAAQTAQCSRSTVGVCILFHAIAGAEMDLQLPIAVWARFVAHGLCVVSVGVWTRGEEERGAAQWQPYAVSLGRIS